jgi:hypothetical protein
MRFTWTIDLGNLLTLGGAILAMVWGWRDMMWRMKNIEEWRSDHNKLAEKALETMEEVKTAIVELKSIEKGQERRLELLEGKRH